MIAAGIEIAGDGGRQLQAVALRGAPVNAVLAAHLLELKLDLQHTPMVFRVVRVSGPHPHRRWDGLKGQRARGCALSIQRFKRCLLLDGNRLEDSCTVTASRRG